VSFSSAVVNLAPLDCIQLLGTHTVGRLCVVEDGFPVAFPVNYRIVVGADDFLAIVIRVRDGGVLDRPDTKAGFQLDGIDLHVQVGWSVVARGTLHEVEQDDAPPWLHTWNPRPWVNDCDAWLYLDVANLSGRQLLEPNPDWIDTRAYL
jgi:hypothetical protein